MADAQFLAGRATTTESGTDAGEKEETAASSFFSPQVRLVFLTEKSHLNLNTFSQEIQRRKEEQEKKMAAELFKQMQEVSPFSLPDALTSFQKKELCWLF